MIEVGYEDIQTNSDNISKNVKASSMILNMEEELSAELSIISSKGATNEMDRTKMSRVNISHNPKLMSNVASDLKE